MLKKKLLVVLLSLATSTVYADAAVNISVRKDMLNQPFNINHEQWGYQFNNATGKTLTFNLAVASTSQGAVNLQCWHSKNPVEESLVQPGQTSTPCVTDDAIRVVVSDDNYSPASGTYSITVGA